MLRSFYFQIFKNYNRVLDAAKYPGKGRFISHFI